jgi:hypothetical protein
MKLTDEERAMRIVAVCWEQFGRGATITIDESAYDKAMEIALPNLRERLSRPEDFSPAELKAAKFCAHKAGREARDFAKQEAKNGFDPVVVDTTYEKAWKKVKDDLDKKNLLRDANGVVRIEAVFC